MTTKREDVNKLLAENHARHFKYRAQILADMVIRGENHVIDEEFLRDEIEAEKRDAELIIAQAIAAELIGEE